LLSYDGTESYGKRRIFAPSSATASSYSPWQEFTKEGEAMALAIVRWITLTTMIMMMCLCCCGCGNFQSALVDDDADVADLDYEGDENLSDESDEEGAENKNESDTQPTFSARPP
jgi:hypothetical protein